MINSEIKKKVLNLKKNKKTIGLCHGVFDLLHYGHILHFETAKKKCDFLFVSITSDQFIKKGPLRPIHNNLERLHFLKNLNFIDFAFVANGESGIDSINLIKPDIYFKGNDYKNNFSDNTKKIFLEIKAVKKNKGKVFYTNEKHMSSSKIINEQGLALSKKHTEFIKNIKKLINFENLVNLLNHAKKSKVLIVGDLIIDKYIFGHVLGKPGKEPHMVFNKMYNEMYIGGSSIIANHLSDFSNKITLISDIGNEQKIKNLLISNLKKNISHIHLHPSKNFKTCVKSRFIDTLSNYKLFGSYSIPNLDDKIFHLLLNRALSKNIKKNDIIIAADYSNNFFDSDSIKKIQQSNKFICGMAQINSNNSKFHTLNHLKNFDLVCVNQGELRSEVKDKKNSIDFIAKDFIKKNNLKFLVIIQGIDGSLLFDKKFNRYYCPSFNPKPIDKVGAGDSMLAILSVLLKNKTNPSIALMIASLVSSNVVNNIGNKYTANRSEIERSLEFLLK